MLSLYNSLNIQKNADGTTVVEDFGSDDSYEMRFKSDDGILTKVNLLCCDMMEKYKGAENVMIVFPAYKGILHGLLTSATGLDDTLNPELQHAASHDSVRTVDTGHNDYPNVAYFGYKPGDNDWKYKFKTLVDKTPDNYKIVIPVMGTGNNMTFLKVAQLTYFGLKDTLEEIDESRGISVDVVTLHNGAGSKFKAHRVLAHIRNIHESWIENFGDVEEDEKDMKEKMEELKIMQSEHIVLTL